MQHVEHLETLKNIIADHPTMINNPDLAEDIKKGRVCEDDLFVVQLPSSRYSVPRVAKYSEVKEAIQSNKKFVMLMCINLDIEEQPSAEELLYMKDELSIADGKWWVLMKTFKLGAGQSLHYVRQARNTANQQVGIMPVSIYWCIHMINIP